jgi:hypothetical protein
LEAVWYHAALPSNARLFESAPVITLAGALVALRTIVYFLFDQVSFDSDQAIVGLMAKHLTEGRAFPLFFYGQAYMLGVEAWVAAPFFALFGPTVGALRLSLFAWNVVAAVLLITGFRRSGLARWMAVVPALFFLVAAPSVSRHLIEAQGGIVEPFLYVALLWFLRDRMLWFGAVLAVGFLNREFTLYVVPVLLALEAATGQLDRARARGWLLAAVAFVAVWESVEALKAFADLRGPGTRGQLLGGFAGSQVANLLARFNWQGDALLDRLTSVGWDLVAWIAGARQFDSSFPVPDRPWLLGVSGFAVLFVLGRVTWLLVRRGSGETSWIAALGSRVKRAEFALYILGVGLVAAAVFVAGKPFLAGYSRYAILALLIPVGAASTALILEPNRGVRTTLVGAVIAWAILSAVDHGRILAAYVASPPSDSARQLADELAARRVEVAEAGYWQAYRLTFLSRERVRVASNDFMRIDEYQAVAHARPAEGVRISERPCPDGELLAGLYLCKRH